MGIETAPRRKVPVAGVPLKLRDEAGPRRKAWRSGFSNCPVCGLGTRTLKLHAFKAHIPSVYHDRETPAQLMTPRFHRARVNYLIELARLVVGPFAGLRDLCSFLDKKALMHPSSEISVTSRTAMRRLGETQGWVLPAVLTLCPMNSIACLIHWRHLLALLSELPGEGQIHFWHICGEVPSVNSKRKSTNTPSSGGDVAANGTTAEPEVTVTGTSGEPGALVKKLIVPEQEFTLGPRHVVVNKSGSKLRVTVGLPPREQVSE